MVKIASKWWKNDQILMKAKGEARKKAAENRKKYRNIMKRYRPPSQEELERRLKEMPKRPRTNWNFYVQVKFASIYPKVHNRKRRSFGALMHYLGGKWRRMSLGSKERYNEMHRQDSLRFQKEFAAFKQKYAPK